MCAILLDFPIDYEANARNITETHRLARDEPAPVAARGPLASIIPSEVAVVGRVLSLSKGTPKVYPLQDHHLTQSKPAGFKPAT